VNEGVNGLYFLPVAPSLPDYKELEAVERSEEDDGTVNHLTPTVTPAQNNNSESKNLTTSVPQFAQPVANCGSEIVKHFGAFREDLCNAPGTSGTAINLNISSASVENDSDVSVTSDDITIDVSSFSDVNDLTESGTAVEDNMNGSGTLCDDSLETTIDYTTSTLCFLVQKVCAKTMTPIFPPHKDVFPKKDYLVEDSFVNCKSVCKVSVEPERFSGIGSGKIDYSSKEFVSEDCDSLMSFSERLDERSNDKQHCSGTEAVLPDRFPVPQSSAEMAMEVDSVYGSANSVLSDSEGSGSSPENSIAGLDARAGTLMTNEGCKSFCSDGGKCDE